MPRLMSSKQQQLQLPGINQELTALLQSLAQPSECPIQSGRTNSPGARLVAG